MTPLVSIIIPVYKVELYIEKCMQSLLDQTYENFEALVVDDGSPDNSIALAKELVGDDPRFIFLEKENGGQGSARNLGLDHAKGDYIAFLDSDDYYMNNYLQVMVNKIIEDKADICLCNILYISVDGEYLRIEKNDVQGFIENRDYLVTRGYVSNFMWDKLFNAICFEDLRFDPTIRSFEDVHIIHKLLFKRTLTHTNKALYNYVQRPGSIMHSVPETYICDRYNIYLSLENFYYDELKKIGCDKNDLTYHYLYNFITITSDRIARYSTKYDEDISNLKKVISADIFTVKNILTTPGLARSTRLRLLLLKTKPNYLKKAVNTLLHLRRLKNNLSRK